MTTSVAIAIRHTELRAWVDDVAALTTPDDVVWCDGSAAEWGRLTDELVQTGTLVRLVENRKPNSFWARTDPTDVARVDGAEAIGSSPAEFAKFVSSEVTRWTEVARKAGLKPES